MTYVFNRNVKKCTYCKVTDCHWTWLEKWKGSKYMLILLNNEVYRYNLLAFTPQLYNWRDSWYNVELIANRISRISTNVRNTYPSLYSSVLESNYVCVLHVTTLWETLDLFVDSSFTGWWTSKIRHFTFYLCNAYFIQQ